jgi:BMFP domain-containing protein YqiC
MTKRHSCCACKAWQRYYRGEMEAAVRASMERMMQREMVSLRSFDVRSTMVINTDASLQGAGISWREHRRAMSTPQRQTRQIRKMLALRLYSSREGQDVVQGA